MTGLFAEPGKRRMSRSAGFVLGYASLGAIEIERGIRGWAEALSDLQSQGDIEPAIDT